MLLQTNSYLVPREKHAEHARLIRRMRQMMLRLGCDSFEAYEQTGSDWAVARPTGRFIQVMRFRDRQHFQRVQKNERSDPAAQHLIREFCDLVNLPYQQEQGLFAAGFYVSVLAEGPEAGRAPAEAETFAPGALGTGPHDQPIGGLESSSMDLSGGKITDAQARAIAQLMGEPLPDDGKAGKGGAGSP